MTDQRKFFLRGLLRLGAAAIVVALMFIACNVIGYLALTYDVFLLIDPDKLRPFDSYFGRVSSLALFGFIQVLLCAGIVALAGVILTLFYFLVLHIGGYRRKHSAVKNT
jgi:hypothetical protein